MKQHLRFFRWMLCLLLFVCGSTFAYSQTKVTSIDDLGDSTIIRIYPYGHANDSSLALACSGDGKALTSYAKAGAGDEWMLVKSITNGYYYLKNELGCYWSNKYIYPDNSLSCTTDKSYAMSAKLTWDSKNGGVCFWSNTADGKGLNNLYGLNYRYNWYSSPSNYTSDTNTTFDVVFYENAYCNVNGIRYKLHFQTKTATVVANDYSGDIVIPQTVSCFGNVFQVTTIADKCFQDCSGLTSITLPNSITSLPNYCFYKCSSLNSVTLPESITSLPYFCFYGCSSLTNITLPEGITRLNTWCFANCSKLTSITVPKTVTYLGNLCFDGCSSLTSITLQEGLTTLDSYCFRNCSKLSNITLPSTLRDIGPDVLGSIKKIACHAKTPPDCDHNNISLFTSVYVPKGTVDLYKEASEWKNSGIILDGVPISSVSLPKEFTMDRTEKKALDYNVYPEDAEYKTLSWSSSNTWVAKVDEKTGVITAIKTGDAVITAVSTVMEGVSASTTVHITPLKISGLSFPGNLDLVHTTSQKLDVEIFPEQADNQKLKWSSDNPKVAIVDSVVETAKGCGTAKIIAKGVGTAIITAKTTDGSNISASTEVHVTPLKVQSMSFAKSEVCVERTKTTKLSLTLNSKDVDDKTMKWTSSNDSVATVSQNTEATYPIEAVVTAHKIGKTTITAEAQDGSGIKATCEVEVTPLTVDSVVLITTSVVKTIPTKLEAKIFPEDADYKELKWSSGSPEMATVTEDGVITGLKVGTTYVNVDLASGPHLIPQPSWGKIQITALPVETITLPTEVSIVKTDSQKLEYTVLPTASDNQKLKWSSNHADIASVNDSTGVITAHKVGDAIITATATDGSGVSASCKVTVTPLKVADINLSTTSAVKTIPTKLEATVTPANADNKKLKWTSLTPEIATVAEDSMITGLKMGTAKVKAEATDSSGVSREFDIAITGLPVSSVSLPANVSVVKTKTGKIAATILPAEADNQNLTWSSSSPDTVKVDAETGEITGVHTGTATIKATAKDGSNVMGTTTVTVTPLLVDSIDIQKELSIIKTKSATLTASAFPSEADDKNVTWTSSDESVVTVTSSGVVKAIKVGTATVTATATDGSGTSATCMVTVTPLKVASISLYTAGVVKTIPTKLNVSVTPSDADNKTLKWTSFSPNLATVTEDGTMTGLKMGTALLRAEATDGSNVAKTFEVEVWGLPVSSISLPKETSIVKTDNQKLEYTVLPAASDNQSLKWSSDQPSIASVDESTGVITANKVGDAIITATATDGSEVSASTTVHVTPLKVSSIDMAKEVTLLRTTTDTIKTTVAPELADNKTLSWTSEDTNIATVTQEGVVKGITVGTTNITATATDGSEVSATCKVTVKPVTINLSTNTINLQKGERYVEQSVAVLPDNYEHTDVVWTASGNGVASVDANGNITAIKPGVDTLRCSLAYDKDIYAECRVIVYDENVVYVGGLYYILDNKDTNDRWATVTSIYGGKNTSLDANNVAQYYSGTINIPETIIYGGNKYTVKKVGSYAFNCQNELQSIYIPRTVTEVEHHAAIKAEKLNRVNVADESELVNIGEEAFKWCSGLKRFTFDGTSLKMESIDKAAFRECTALERFTWTGNTTVKTIGNSAFYACTALEKVLWNGKSELKSIMDYAFFKCSALNNFDMPNTTLSVGNSSFRYNASLTDIHLSTSLNYIDEYAFGECGFSHITLPESLVNIQAGAFINNDYLQEITLPERLPGLGSAAFENNSKLESVTFLTDIETMTIGNNAFNQCPVLNKVYITNMNSFAQTNFNNAKANPANTSQHIYDANGNEIINVVLPKGTKYVNNNAFNGCAYIESIEMPATMDHINDDIFVGCSALKNVYCYAEEVPEFIGVNDPSSMSDVFAQATLHVIYGSEAAYKADNWWGRFYQVVGCDDPYVEDIKVTSITISQDNVTLKPDDTVQLEATVYPTNATNKKVLWSSSNDEVAMVTDEGFVLAIAEGEADITAESADSSGIKAVCHVKVEKEQAPVVPIVEIKFEESPVSIAMGETKTLKVIFNPENASNKQLAWTSAKPSVVEVDQEGNILGVSEGKSIVSAKTTDGSDLTINCVVTVTKSSGIGYVTVGDLRFIVNKRHLSVEGLSNSDAIKIVNAFGFTVYEGTEHEIDLITPGIYIVKAKGKTLKIYVK